MKNSFKRYRIDTLIKIAKTTSNEQYREELLRLAANELDMISENSYKDVEISINGLDFDELRIVIEDYLSDKERVCIKEIWNKCLDRSDDCPRYIALKIANILDNAIHGWYRIKSPYRSKEYGTQKGWEKK